MKDLALQIVQDFADYDYEAVRRAQNREFKSSYTTKSSKQAFLLHKNRHADETERLKEIIPTREEWSARELCTALDLSVTKSNTISMGLALQAAGWFWHHTNRNGESLLIWSKAKELAPYGRRPPKQPELKVRTLELLRQGLTQREIAVELGRDPAQINRWVKGQSRPENKPIAEIQQKLSEGLSVTRIARELGVSTTLVTAVKTGKRK